MAGGWVNDPPVARGTGKHKKPPQQHVGGAGSPQGVDVFVLDGKEGPRGRSNSMGFVVEREVSGSDGGEGGGEARKRKGSKESGG